MKHRCDGPRAVSALISAFISSDALVEQYADIVLAGVAGSAIEPETVEQIVAGRRLHGGVAGLARAAAASQSRRRRHRISVWRSLAVSRAPPAFYSNPAPAAQPLHAYNGPAADPELEHRAGGYETDPPFLRQQVDYHGKEAPGTIVIDTPITSFIS
jgi:lipoprotein-anchoring transpeptidase ErfK/SrfK